MGNVRTLSALFTLFVCTMFFVSCEEEVVHHGKTPLVSVGKQFLYKEDIQRFYNANPPETDSVAYVDEYINRWIEEAVFYNVATRNVPSSKEIEKLVESYKRSLVLSIYQEGLVEQHLKPEITPEDVQAFYESNRAMFEVEEPVVKGLFIRVPVNDPKLNSLRKWCNVRTEENLEKLDKYSFTNNVVYDYFVDSWKPLSEIAARTPITETDLLQRLVRKSEIEFKDEKFVYMVSVDSIVNRGETKPQELVEAEIRELLVNTLKAEFIKEQKRILHDEAAQKGAIKFYKEE